MIQLPSDFEKRMQLQLRKEFNSFIEALDTASPVSIRINPYKTDKIPDLAPVPWSTTGFYLPERPSFTLDPLFHAGVYYVQEPSSMFIEQVFRQHSEGETGRRILDLCAAPGGKSTHILSLIHASDLLVSNEVIRQRSQILAENISKWGQPNNIVTCNDPSAFAKLKDFFDLIVIDAPCSGEGLFRRDAKAMNEWSVDNTRLCTQRQQRIIADVWDSLSDNGILIYSTCTYNPQENEDNLQWISQNYNVEFLTIDIPTEWGIHEIRKGNCVGYSFMPHRTQGEGFFLAALRKQGSGLRTNPFKDKKPGYLPADKKHRPAVAEWINPSEGGSLIQKEDTLYLFPEEMLPVLNTLNKVLYPIKTGTSVAEIKAKNLLPTHELALSSFLNKNAFPTFEVDLETALHYLRRDEIKPQTSKNGLNLLTYEGHALGWIKNLGNRSNNLYPKEWRIRMEIPNKNEGEIKKSFLL